ncbi:DMT family transporter [Kordiimonas lacus]|uniref:Probable blue pigment (Indigoidine) exporter n=1 Tax=Kordiimonas lacus TaxID=637679 RepID=A0A1G7B084_9PROT|nr:EamA family transporter [Kordiimonas lacus]SDE20257.1 probable blue pigment (indigoidine) exporter [Kordiimonas lacus]
MSKRADILTTAIAPMIWGSSYIMVTEFLPGEDPFMVSMLRALPAGLLLLALVRRLPQGIWWGRMFLLGALNFTIFWGLLFVAAYRLPGGVAATLGAVQPLMVLFISRYVLGTGILPIAVGAAFIGILGVAMLVLSPGAEWDMIGIAAAAGSAVSMAFGTVLSRRWQPDVSPLTVTAWQLTAGGLLLIPVAFTVGSGTVTLNSDTLFGLGYLSLIGAAATYLLWFRGVSRLLPSEISPLGFLSPVTAVVLGWALLGETLSTQALLGILLTLGSVWLSQNAATFTFFFKKTVSQGA